MLRLKDIMTAGVVSVEGEMTLRQLMEILTSRHISGAPVMQDGAVVGVVSTTDVLNFLATAPDTPAEEPEADEDELPPRWDEESDSPGAFFAEWYENDSVALDEHLGQVARHKPDLLAEHTVDEVMTRALVSLPSTARVDQAAELMRDRKIHRVLAIDDGELVGIVTMKDISDAVAEHKLTSRAYVFGSDWKYEDRA